MTTNTLESLIDVLVSECGMQSRLATHTASYMIKLASAHLILMTRDCNEGLDARQLGQVSSIERWFELMAEATQGIDAVSFKGDIRATTVFLKLTSGTSNSFSGDWRVPVKIPSTPMSAMMRTLRKDIHDMMDSKARRDENSKYPASTATPLAAEHVHGHLLATWIGNDPVEPMSFNAIKFGLTAVLNGIKLFTGPKSVMDRVDMVAPYAETPGLAWMFLNESGERVQGFNGRGNGTITQGTFSDLAKYVPELSLAEWVYKKVGV